MRKFWKKMVSGCNSVATKTTQRSITPHLTHCMPLCKSVTVSQNGRYGKL